MSNRDAGFQGRTLAILIALGAAAFAIMAYLLVTEDERRAYRSAGANAFSPSAIGHAAFVELLDRLAVPTLVSRFDSARRTGAGSVLMLAEPPSEQAIRPILDHLSETYDAGAVIVVLPKWTSQRQDPRRWLVDAALLSPTQVNAVLTAMVEDASVVRPETAGTWATGPFSVAPTLASPQLIRSESLTPVIGTENGMLIGEMRMDWRRVWILSDPDILANHGIGQGDNAQLIMDVVDSLRAPTGAVVIDETIHGFQLSPSLWRTLFSPPFLIASLNALATLGLVVWASGRRFGNPTAVRQPFQPGTSTLVDISADLMRPGQHGPHILGRYADMTLERVARKLHAPRNLDDRGLQAWVDRVGASRRPGETRQAIQRELDVLVARASIDPGRCLAAARRLHKWKQDMLDGSR